MRQPHTAGPTSSTVTARLNSPDTLVRTLRYSAPARMPAVFCHVTSFCGAQLRKTISGVKRSNVCRHYTLRTAENSAFQKLEKGGLRWRRFQRLHRVVVARNFGIAGAVASPPMKSLHSHCKLRMPMSEPSFPTFRYFSILTMLVVRRAMG